MLSIEIRGLWVAHSGNQVAVSLSRRCSIRKQLRQHLNVFISISLKQQSRETLQAFEEPIVLRDEVMECHLMSSDADYLLRVAVPDMPALEASSWNGFRRLRRWRRSGPVLR